MLALQHHRDACCPNCGGWIEETTDRDAEDTYEADLIRCHRCAAQSVAADRTKNMWRPESLLMQVTKKPQRR